MTDSTTGYDLFSPDFKADPFGTYAEMRGRCPVYAHEAPYGARIWYITRYDDVLAVLKDTDRFVKANPHRKPRPAGKGNIFRMINRNMLFADEADHGRLRSLVNLAFTPRRVADLGPRIHTIAHRLLDTAVADGRTEMELIEEYALPLPMMVIMEMLGIPTADQAQMHAWTKAIIAPGRYGIDLKERKARVRAFVAYLQQAFAARRKQPGDDLISALVQAEQAGDRLTEAELSSMVALLFVTGHETVVNLIGNGTLALLTHPAQLAHVRRTGDWGAAVEELLRFDGPVETSTTRWAAEDVDLHGRTIRRGDVVRVVLTSANRDAGRFARPDDLDVTRPDGGDHLAFGHGVHYCLGAALARLEGRIGLRLLFSRLDGLQLAVRPDEIEWQTGVIFRGAKAIPLVWGDAADA